MATDGTGRPGGAERAQEAGAAAPGRGGRMARQRKRDAVLRLLRGELETVSRSLGVTAATLSGGRDALLAAGEASRASRPADAAESGSQRLKARLGEMLLKRELLEATITALETGRPVARRRSWPCAAPPHRAAASPRASSPSAGSGGWPAPPSIATARQPGLRHRVAQVRPGRCRILAWSRRSAGSSTTAPAHDSACHGEGHRNLWARRRVAGIRTAKRRVLRLMRPFPARAVAGRRAPRGRAPMTARSFRTRST